MPCKIRVIIIFFLILPHNIFATKISTDSKDLENTIFAYCQRAQASLAIHDFKRWKNSLISAERILQKKQYLLTPLQKYELQLWITLLWFKYYQMKGQGFKIYNISKFNKKSELLDYIKYIKKHIFYLKKSSHYLQYYHTLYAKISEKMKRNSLIYIQAALPLRIIRSVRDAQIYLSILKYARDHWDARNHKKNIEKKFKQLTQLSKKKEYNNVEEKNKKVAIALYKAQNVYLALRREESIKKSIGQKLFLGGVIVGGLALIPLVIGTIYFNKGYDTNNQDIAERSGNRQKGIILMTIGLVSLTLGTATTITGLLIQPNEYQQAQNILKAQDIYLDAERKNLHNL